MPLLDYATSPVDDEQSNETFILLTLVFTICQESYIYSRNNNSEENEDDHEREFRCLVDRGACCQQNPYPNINNGRRKGIKKSRLIDFDLCGIPGKDKYPPGYSSRVVENTFERSGSQGWT